MESFASEFLSVCDGNGSEGNTTSDLWLVEDRTSGLVTAAFLLLFTVIGLPWNLLVIVTIVKQRLYTQPTIILLLNLVVTDIILLVFYALFSIATGFKGEYILGNSDEMRCATCKLGCVITIFFLNSIFTLSLMSLDRFLFIYKALEYKRLITKWRTVVAIAVAWVVAILVSILPLVGFGKFVYDPEFITCLMDVNISNSYYPILAVLVAILPLVILMVCNIWLCCIVQANIRAIYALNKPSSPESDEFNRTMKKERHKKELHSVKVFGALIGSTVISTTPTVVVLLMSKFGVDVSAPPVAAAYILFISQLTAHPIIETTLIKDVRVPLKRLFFYCRTQVQWKARNSIKVPLNSPRNAEKGDLQT